GCTVTAMATITAPTAITLSSAPTNITCYGGTNGAIDLSVSGGSGTYSYQWTGPGVFTASTQDLAGLVAGTYDVPTMDANGCTAPSVSGGSGPDSYRWPGPGRFTASTPDLAGLAAGTYDVTTMDANGCTAIASVSIAQPTVIQATAAIATTACQGANTGAIDLTVSGGAGGYGYLWTGFPAFSATTEDISDLFAGVYTVLITDADGCSFSTSYNAGEPGLFDISAELSSMAG